MSVPIFCPNPDCGASYNVVEAQLGKVGRCKKCGTTFPLVAKLFSSEDVIEGPRAFAEKRKPRWKNP